MRNALITVAAASLLAVTATAAQTPRRPERHTTGECVSEGFYGNEPNIVGSFVNTGPNEPPRDDRTRGASVGDANRVLHVGEAPGVTARNLPQACKTITDPAPGGGRP